MGIVKDSLYHFANKKHLSFFREQTIFPYYHIINENKVAHIKHLYPYKSESRFKLDLDVLIKNYRPIQPKNLFGNGKIRNGFLLTFDDGLSEMYSTVYPILKEKNISAIFFINPLYVDNKRLFYKHGISLAIELLNQKGLSENKKNEIAGVLQSEGADLQGLTGQLRGIKYRDKDLVYQVLNILDFDTQQYLEEHKPCLTSSQIEEMAQNGFFFGGHTMSHPPMNELTLEKQKAEVIESIEWLKQNFQIDYSFFAFPFSDRKISKRLIRELFEYDENLLIFGNAGIKNDIDHRIIQRFSLENPSLEVEKKIITENLYKYFNKSIGKYHIKRK